MLNSFGCKYCLRRYLKDHFSRIDWCNLIDLRVPLCINIYSCDRVVKLNNLLKVFFFFILFIHIREIGK